MSTNMRAARPLALVLVGSLLAPTLAFGAAGCGNSSGGSGTATTPAAAPQTAPSNAPTANTGIGTQPMANNTAMNSNGAQTHIGLSTKQKVVLLAGAALLY